MCAALAGVFRAKEGGPGLPYVTGKDRVGRTVSLPVLQAAWRTFDIVGPAEDPGTSDQVALWRSRRR